MIKLLLLLIVRINVLISKNIVKNVVIRMIFFQCTELNKKKKRLNQRFSSILIRNECLLHFCEEDVVLKVCNDI